jgi:hypothetical protein
MGGEQFIRPIGLTSSNGGGAQNRRELVARGRKGDGEAHEGGWEPNDENVMRETQGDLAIGQPKGGA